jgi:hypothetical protein
MRCCSKLSRRTLGKFCDSLANVPAALVSVSLGISRAPADPYWPYKIYNASINFRCRLLSDFGVIIRELHDLFEVGFVNAPSLVIALRTQYLRAAALSHFHTA